MSSLADRIKIARGGKGPDVNLVSGTGTILWIPRRDAGAVFFSSLFVLNI